MGKRELTVCRPGMWAHRALGHIRGHTQLTCCRTQPPKRVQMTSAGNQCPSGPGSVLLEMAMIELDEDSA